jgi:glycosyltransferase involved in cell wall biosynthesis
MDFTDTFIIIPAYNEADNIVRGVEAIRAQGFSNIVVGVDYATTDATETLLSAASVTFVRGVRTGYDGSVSAAVNYLKKKYSACKYVVFTDAGGKFPPAAIKDLVYAADEGAELVLGVRVTEQANLFWHQRLGNAIVLLLIRIACNTQVQDISPFRLIRLDVLRQLDMRGRRFRWPSEMLVKCLACKVRMAEIPVVVLKREGTSKVSGNILNSARAGIDMFSSLQFIRFVMHKQSESIHE